MMNEPVYTEACLTVLKALGLAYGHWYADFILPEEDAGATRSLLMGRLWKREVGADESQGISPDAPPLPRQVYGPPAPAPGYHETGSGRLRWSVDEMGRATVTIWRPHPQVLAARARMLDDSLGDVCAIESAAHAMYPPAGEVWRNWTAFVDWPGLDMGPVVLTAVDGPESFTSGGWYSQGPSPLPSRTSERDSGTRTYNSAAAETLRASRLRAGYRYDMSSDGPARQCASGTWKCVHDYTGPDYVLKPPKAAPMLADAAVADNDDALPPQDERGIGNPVGLDGSCPSKSTQEPDIIPACVLARRATGVRHVGHVSMPTDLSDHDIPDAEPAGIVPRTLRQGD